MDFLQSEQWRKFQEATGKRTFLIEDENFRASIIEHELPLVGKYFYIPRGIICHPERIRQLAEESKDLIRLDSSTTVGMTRLLDLAKKEKAGWIRFDAGNKEILKIISEVKPRLRSRGFTSIVKAPHDMQPREVFVINIAKSEEELLAEMKSKTRYNIKLAEKKGVKVFTTQDKKYIDEFIKLVKITAKRDGITSHSEEYYRQMFEIISPEIIKLYIAEYQGKVIAANIVIFYPVRNSKTNTLTSNFLSADINNNISNGVNDDTAIYLHGASDNEYRNVMAPHLLQWQQILDAKKIGCVKYDFGGIKSGDNNSWSGITKFKIGFSPNIQPIEFSGSYDIVINPMKYCLYRIIQKLKSFI